VSDLIKLNAAAKMLTVSRRTIDRLIAQGQLSVVRVSADRYAISVAEVERYIAANTITRQPISLRPKITSLYDGNDAEERLRKRFSEKHRRASQRK
jgi:excisionase family DNA binding protein